MYRHGNRAQSVMFPPSVEDYVPEAEPVRVYDAFVEQLDLNDLGFLIDPHKEGRPEYFPKTLLKLLVYGYSYGFRSSRKLERACHHNLTFIWLAGGLKPDHNTLARFRKQNRGALKNVLRQCAKLCIELNLIAGNTLFVDGSKIRANAGYKNSWTPKRAQEALAKLDERIDAMLKQCDQTDRREAKQGSLVKGLRPRVANQFASLFTARLCTAEP